MSWAEEQWLPVVGFEGRYEVSHLGNVRSIGRGTHHKIMGGGWARGYRIVQLSKPGGNKTNHTIHRLVCAAFIGDRPQGHDINHKNGVKSDNHRDNLEYCTKSENMKHCFQIGLQSNAGENHSQAKITHEVAAAIRLRRDEGETQVSIARSVGIDQAQISRICSGKAWNDKTFKIGDLN